MTTPAPLELGPIVGLFVQRNPLKQGRAPMRRYRTDDIVPVASVEVNPSGVTGQTANGDSILDVHHRDHPASRDRKGIGGVSLMATGDYRRLRERYGAHLFDGSAGCTLLVENEAGFAGRSLGAKCVIRTAGGDVVLQQVQVAVPCVEFSRFCLGLEPSAVVGDDIRQALVHLDGGGRGFKGVARANGRIALGDMLWSSPANAL